MVGGGGGKEEEQDMEEEKEEMADLSMAMMVLVCGKNRYRAAKGISAGEEQLG